MSRYSPTVAPQPLDLGSALRAFGDSFGQAQERKRRSALQDRAMEIENDRIARQGEIDTERRELHDLELGRQGIYRGAVPITEGSVVAPMFRDKSANPLQQSLARRVSGNAPLDPAGRYKQITPNFYQDNTQNPEVIAAGQKAREQEALGAALRVAGIPASLTALLAQRPELIDNVPGGPFAKPESTTPARGTPAYLKMIEDEERVRGRVRAQNREPRQDTTEDDRRKYILSRIGDLTRPRRDPELGIERPGLSQEAAVAQANREWATANGASQSQPGPVRKPLQSKVPSRGGLPAPPQNDLGALWDEAAAELKGQGKSSAEIVATLGRRP